MYFHTYFTEISDLKFSQVDNLSLLALIDYLQTNTKSVLLDKPKQIAVFITNS